MAVPLGVFAFSNAAGPNTSSGSSPFPSLSKPPSFSSLLSKKSQLTGFETPSPKTRAPGGVSPPFLSSKTSSSSTYSSHHKLWRSLRKHHSSTSVFRRAIPERARSSSIHSSSSTVQSSDLSRSSAETSFGDVPLTCLPSPIHARADLLPRAVSGHASLAVQPHIGFGSLESIYSSDPTNAEVKQCCSDSRRDSAQGHSSIGSRPRHVEIQIPIWAQPLWKQSNKAPRIQLRQSTFKDPFEDLTRTLAEGDPPNPRNSTARSTTQFESMDSFTSETTGGQPPVHLGNNDIQTALGSGANGSQTSLTGKHDEYDSTSEAESVQEYQPDTSAPVNDSRVSPPVQQPSSQPTTTAAPALSGLVCNVHRTTGQEPPSLVGATTTVLGDMLYVFGGRRLSRSMPQLTSDLYQLDMVRRHWTRLEVRGNVPPPRYFHSVCALGDSKLVCYGGMSPVPSTDAASETQAEVIVMSDIHIFDVKTKTWQKINTQDAPQGRYAHCAAILPSSAVFASAKAPLSAVHHNPSGTNPNQGTLGIALDGSGGAEMIVVGGQDNANHYIEQVSVFNLRSLRWTGTTGMGRSCGAYRSVVCPLTSMPASQIGAGPDARLNDDDDDEDDDPTSIGSGAPMLIYSNYNFLDVRLELQVRLPDGTLIEKPMQTGVSPPGLRFPSGGIIDNHLVVSGTFLTSTKQEYALWALDLRTLTWSRIDAGGSIFSAGSWNRGVLWSRRHCFVILGNRKRSLVDDYNNRRINFSNICLVELEAFGLYESPRKAAPMSSFVSASGNPENTPLDVIASGRQLHTTGEELGSMALGLRELADMDMLAIDGTRIPVNSRLIAQRWGPYFINLLKESASTGSEETATLRPMLASNRISSITITPSVSSTATTLPTQGSGELPDTRSSPSTARARVVYLPHTAPTLQALLHYLYTSTLPGPSSPLATPQILCSLLQLARPYKVDGLLETVVARLHESLDGRNAAAIFNAAAMGAGGGEGTRSGATSVANSRSSTIPLRAASLHGIDSLLSNGTSRTNGDVRPNLRLPNGLPAMGAQSTMYDDDDDERPSSATTDESSSSSESRDRRLDELAVWNGSLSAVVGLQKRGLRGLMEGRRMRERGRTEGSQSSRVGLGIA